MENILAPTYFRLVYLLQLPLLTALVAAAAPQLTKQTDFSARERVLTAIGLVSLLIGFVHSYHGLSITPKYPKLGIGWKSPGEYQLLPANVEFAKAAGKYIAHAKFGKRQTAGTARTEISTGHQDRSRKRGCCS